MILQAHDREYLGAVSGMGEVYGEPTYAVGDSLTIRVPGTANTSARAVVVEVLDETTGTYHVAAHVPGGGRQHFAITAVDILPF